MPYLTLERKEAIDNGEVPQNAGEVNYKVTQVFVEYLTAHGVSYGRCEDCTGGAEDAVAELRRRLVNPYEDLKIACNGDVYPEHLLSQVRVKEPF